MEAILRMELPPKVFLINRFHGERLGKLLLLKMKAGETRRMELPPKVFLIKPSLRMRNRGYLWNTASTLSDITLIGWEFQYLHQLLLDQTKAWQICIRNSMHPQSATPRRIQFGSRIMDKILETILSMIQDLPNQELQAQTVL